MEQSRERTTYVCEELNDDDMTQVTELFREQRRQMGVEESDAAWFADPLDDWLACLERGGDGLSRESVASLAAGMREKLAFRDALIVSLLCRGVDRSQLMELAARPHRPESVRCLSRALNDAFRDADAAPDRRRCERGLKMLAQIARAVPPGWRVQPMTLVAYVLWWMGDPRAVVYAVRVLADDERCTLAGIVLSAMEHGIAPAWMGDGMPGE
ncbi:DUF4192 family protein [Bifidobacterium avesanii]|uniref:DUF4192 family protein n=1 Tax=Bifidobacterium avesanii TaxID=1798157 RepID=A0A7K3TKI9_9BIFI|nr:DUF4192 family protein [Bifidobacterium avesanii]KAB8288525.1 hypothetical protein DSM100685_1733 [Bifidobacterium avesanii]NEG79249.1 DUF4192 family protein [Bifidobacterium avesanii]